MSLKYNGKDEWTPSVLSPCEVVECHLCLLRTPTKQTIIIPIDYDYFGIKGKMLVSVCKECHRDQQLKKLIEELQK
jgi:hypothetical protein